MPRHPGRQELRLTFRVQPADVPWACRVRALLKYAGRALSLKCLSVEDVTPQASQGAAVGVPPAGGPSGGDEAADAGVGDGRAGTNE
jgi:hypothetical protein